MNPPNFALSNDSKVQCYRLLWLPAFEKNTAVRLTIMSDDTGTLDIKIMNELGKNEPARLNESKTIYASKQIETLPPAVFIQLRAAQGYSVPDSRLP